MVHRKLFYPLLNHLPKKEFSIITGARQTGKSTLLHQLEYHCKKEGIPCVFLNLEHKPLLADLNHSPLGLLNYLPDSASRIIVLIDEIQYLDDPTNFLKLIHDEYHDRLKLIVTGSSAFYIDRKFRDSLAGRKRLFRLQGCSFEEYLDLRKRPELLTESERLRTKPGSKSTVLPLLKMEWENFMIFGGYPGIITAPDTREKQEMLRDLRDSFIKRDIEDSGIQNEILFYKLMRILAAQTGSLLNINALANTLRAKHDTINNYLWTMQKCFHLALLKPFFRNLKKELVKMPVSFFLDNGLRNSLLENFLPLEQRSDKGELWENTVFKILNEGLDTDQICHWRTSAGNEVDFVFPYLPKPFALEAKYDSGQAKPQKYKAFSSAYPMIPLQFACYQPFDESFFSSPLFQDALRPA